MGGQRGALAAAGAGRRGHVFFSTSNLITHAVVQQCTQQGDFLGVPRLLLLVDKLEVLGALEGVVRLVLALDTLEAEHNLLGGLGLLVENGLGLTTVTLLLAVVATLTYSGRNKGVKRYSSPWVEATQAAWAVWSAVCG